MRQAVKIIAGVAAITTMAAAAHQAAKADFPPQAVSAQDLQQPLQQPKSDGAVAVPDLKQFEPDGTDALTEPPQFKSDGPIAFVDLPQPMGFDYSPLKSDSPQFTFLNSSQVSFPVSFPDPPQVSFPASAQVEHSESAHAAQPSTEPPQPVSLEQPVRGKALTAARDLGPARERFASLELPRDTDPPPARQLGLPISHIQFDAPALAPMAHTFFCLKYRDECKVDTTAAGDDTVTLTAQRWGELLRVNAAVNRAIIPQPNTRGLAGEVWLISPRAGECHDYAVTKRHELLALGWPKRDLLLSEVVTSWGEHHLVLVIRTSDGDFVADNLSPKIRIWFQVPYQWVRVQSPDNPTIWSTIVTPTARARASGQSNPS